MREFRFDQPREALPSAKEDRPIHALHTIKPFRSATPQVSPDLDESCYRLLFEANPYPMWAYDLETLAFRAVNEAAIHQFGYSRDEFLTMTIAEIRPPEDIPALRADAAGLRGTAYRESISRLRRKNGSVFEAEITSNSLQFAGRTARLVLAHDVTERVQMNRALLRAEAKYRTIFENAVEGVFQTTPDGRYLDANPALAQIYGYNSPADLIAELTDIGRQLYVDPARRAEFAREMRLHGSVFGFESQVRRRDGRVIWITESSRAVCDENGRLLYYEGIVEDITRRKETEEQILTLNVELNRRLDRVAALRRIDLAIIEGQDLGLTLEVCLDQIVGQLCVDASVIHVWEAGTRTTLQTASRGLRHGALVSEPLIPREEFVSKPQENYRIGNLIDLTRDSRTRNPTPHLIGERFVSYFALPLTIKGQVKGILEIFHRKPLAPDSEWLSYLETLAGQLAIAIDNACLFDELRRSNSDLASAYDATIEGWSRALDLRDEETEGHSRRVTEMTLRVAEELGIPEADRVHVRRGALLHDIGKMGVPDRILLKPGPLSEDEWRIMRRHPQYAYEMLWPIEFLRPAIAIPYCHHERWDGSGYPRGLRGDEIPLAARIFATVDVWDALRSDRPYRPAWSEARVVEHLRSLAGTHLDPDIVEVFLRTIAPQDTTRAHGRNGHELSAGAQASRISASRSAGEAEDFSIALETIARPAGTPMQVLIVEDHEPSARELSHMLEALGHEVFFAADGEEAWRIVQEGGPRLVISDWTARGIDGPRLCRRIRALKNTPYVYIIILTARGESADRLECLHAGADDFLSKPPDVRELAARMEIARRILDIQSELESKNARLAELVSIDSLTGLKNRRHFFESLESAFSRAIRCDEALSVVMVDVDGFKSYNDEFGHPAGDDLLCVFADRLRSSAREHDVVARYGGEEFAIILPATDAEGGRTLSKRLQTSLLGSAWPFRKITASFGVATLSVSTSSAAELVAEADRAMYASKRSGRNRVTHHEDLDTATTAVTAAKW